MNKKLRRLLGRRRNADNLDSKKLGYKSLPALLSKRDNAEPNFYFRNEQEAREYNKNKEKNLAKDADELIVIPDAVNNHERAVCQPPVVVNLTSSGEQKASEKIDQQRVPMASDSESERRESHVHISRVDASTVDRDGPVVAPTPLDHLTRNVSQVTSADRVWSLRSIVTRPSKQQTHDPRLQQHHVPDVFMTDGVGAADNFAVADQSQCACSASCDHRCNLNCSSSSAICACDCRDQFQGSRASFDRQQQLLIDAQTRRHRGHHVAACRNESADMRQQRDCDWGWVSMTDDRNCACDSSYAAPLTTSLSRCSNTPWHHRCCGNTPGWCGHSGGMTSHRNRAKERRQHVQSRSTRPRSCRCSPSRCRNKMSSTCHLRAHCCQHCSDDSRKASSAAVSQRFQTAAKVLFTIVDEDAVERRPRVLEFGHSEATQRPAEELSLSLTSSCCEVYAQGDIKDPCELMDWHEDARDTLFGCHCSETVGNCLHQQHVNIATPFVTSTSSHSPSNMTISFSGSEQVIHPSQTRSTLCPCGRSSCPRRQVTPMSRSYPNDKRQSGHDPASAFGNDKASLAHFELSKRAYAKLIAYCHSKQLLINMYTSSPGQSGDFLSMHESRNANGATPPLSDIGTSAANSSALSCSSAGDDFEPSPSQGAAAAAELCRLARIFERVEECPWYFGAMSGQEAKLKLRGSPPGTFLLRDSSDSRYLFSLSLMTQRGPTSIRIIYSNGSFHFESERDGASSPQEKKGPSSERKKASRRECVVRMILHYTDCLTRGIESNLSLDSMPTSGDADATVNDVARGGSGAATQERGRFMCYWVDRGGRKEIPVQLNRPLGGGIPSLQQISRTCLNRHCRLWDNPKTISSLPLPYVLRNYISKYPYPL